MTLEVDSAARQSLTLVATIHFWLSFVDAAGMVGGLPLSP
jgi:hypothetical protein